MKLALISDIHANLEALVAVLRDIEQKQIDKLISLGDVIGYGVDPTPCLKLVDSHCDMKLMGNHEHAVLGLTPLDCLNGMARESIEWTTKEIGDRGRAIIEDYQLTFTHGQAKYVHSSPFEPSAWHYIMHVHDARKAFTHFNEALCFFGHTHIPVLFTKPVDGDTKMKAGHSIEAQEGCRYLVNVGSVGQPRDNDPRACYVIFDEYEGLIEFHRVAYDIGLTQSKMADAQVPKVLIERLEEGR